VTIAEHYHAINGSGLLNIRARHTDFMIQQLSVLVVEDNAFMRQIVRGLLGNIGVKKVYEAVNGITGLEMIREVSPDIVVLDWEMPMLSGPDLVRIVRSPGVFPSPDIPIIMLSGHVERWRIVQAVKLGVNEFLCKPVSAKALQERLISILLKPRETVRFGDYYGPAPRGSMLSSKFAGLEALPTPV
jgi:two-component system chemotaxis response regulator CheY